MVDKINDEPVLPATSQVETVQRLIPVPVKNELVEDRNIYKECLTPECDC